MKRLDYDELTAISRISDKTFNWPPLRHGKTKQQISNSDFVFQVQSKLHNKTKLLTKSMLYSYLNTRSMKSKISFSKFFSLLIQISYIVFKNSIVSKYFQF